MEICSFKWSQLLLKLQTNIIELKIQLQNYNEKKKKQKKTNKNSAFVTATIYIQFSLESSSFLKAKFGLPTNLVPDVRIIYCAQ